MAPVEVFVQPQVTCLANLPLQAAAEAFTIRTARIGVTPIGTPRGTPFGTPLGTPRGTPFGTPWGTSRCADGCLPAGPLENGYELSLTDEERANLEAAEAAALSGQFALQQQAQQEEQEFVELETDAWAVVTAAKSAAGMAESAPAAAAAPPSECLVWVVGVSVALQMPCYADAFDPTQLLARATLSVQQQHLQPAARASAACCICALSIAAGATVSLLHHPPSCS